MDIFKITQEISTLLKDLSKDEIDKVLRMVATVLDVQAPIIEQKQKNIENNKISIIEFLEKKGPKTQREKFAVIAGYLEQYRDQNSYSKENFKQMFDEAREKFDDRNFINTMESAKKANLFISTRKGEYKLSAIGIKLVNSLPERE